MRKPKSKSARTLIAALIALVVLGGGFALLTLLPDNDPSPSPTPTLAPQDTILSQDRDALKSVSCVRSDGAADYAIATTADADAEIYTYNLSPGFPGFTYVDFQMAYLISSLVSLKGTLLTDDPSAEQLADFGLNPAQIVWTVKGEKTETLSLGFATPSGGGYYVQVNGGSAVYTISAYNGRTLSCSEADLRVLNLMPVIDPDNTKNTLTSIKVENTKGSFTLRSVTDYGDMDFLLSGSFQIVEPVEYDTNEYYVSQNLIIPLAQINPYTVVEDHPADLSIYGLDKPVRVTLTMTDDTVLTLLFGSEDKENGGRYIMYDGVDSVLKDSSGNYPFLTAVYSDFMFSIIWMYDIRTVDKVTFGLASGDRLLEFHYSGEGDDQVMAPTLDGKPIIETNARPLYVTVLSLSIAEILDPPPAIKPVYTFTIHFLDGSKSTLTLTQYNDREYAASLDGGPAKFGVYLKDVQNLLDKLAIVDSGGDITAG